MEGSMAMGKQRRASPADAEVGRRVRTRRLEQGLSQTELADKIGVTFQQVQKYEKGVNRIGAGRLQAIAGALEVQMTYFFEKRHVEGAKHSDSTFELLQSSGSVRLLKAYHAIKSRKMRQLLIEIAEEAQG